MTPVESTVRLGAVTVQPARGDREANYDLAERLVAEAAGQGAEVVVLRQRPRGHLVDHVRPELYARATAGARQPEVAAARA